MAIGSVMGHQAELLGKMASSVARESMVSVELGTFEGVSAFGVLPTIKKNNGHMFLIDWFRGCDGDEYIDVGAGNKILSKLRLDIEEAGYSDCCDIIVGKTDSIVQLIRDESIDFLFIDADHRYEYVYRDIELWYPKIRYGGIICGHDFEKTLEDAGPEFCMNNKHKDCIGAIHPGVILAVSEHFPGTEPNGNCWFHKKER